MLKSCSYCGRIHDSKHQCSSKPKRDNYKITYIDKFRWTKVWQRKREEIKTRDKYLCQVCLRKLYNTQTQYNYIDLEVHHIVPIKANWDRRLDDDNLITLCSYHHKMADSNSIGKDELFAMIDVLVPPEVSEVVLEPSRTPRIYLGAIKIP